MTDPGQVGDTRVTIPVRTAAGEPKMDASVPMATEPEVGDTVAIVWTGDPAMRYMAAPMRVPEVGETVVLEPIANPRGGIRYLGIPTARERVPVTWETDSIPGHRIFDAAAIGPRSAVLLSHFSDSGLGDEDDYIFRTDDSGQTWVQRALPKVYTDGTKVRWFGVCDYDGAGSYLVYGERQITSGSTMWGRFEVWKYDLADDEFSLLSYLEESDHHYIQNYWRSILRTSAGFLCVLVWTTGGTGRLGRTYFSPDGVAWTPRAIPSGSLYSVSPKCPGGTVALVNFNFSNSHTIHQTTDGGASYTQLLTKSGTATHIVAAWSNGVILVEGARYTGIAPWYVLLYVSCDGGQSWETIQSKDYVIRLEEMGAYRYFAEKRDSAGFAFTGCDYGVYITRDSGRHWERVFEYSGSSGDHAIAGVVLPNGVCLAIYNADLPRRFIVVRSTGAP